MVALSVLRLPASDPEPDAARDLVAEPAASPPVLDVVVPVLDEVHVLDASIRRLHAHLSASMPYPWRITIADNGSTDGTRILARRLGAELRDVRLVELDRRGRGRALRAAWSTSDAAVLAYTDVDLSTDLDALLPLVAPLVSGHSDLAIGSRLTRGSSVARGPRREAISRAYNLILRTVFAARFTDAQCGFKAIRADAAAVLLPEVEDDAWSFDTELLLLADHNDLRIHEVAVDWVDDPDSRVDVRSTARDDLRGVARMVRRFASGRGRIDEARYRRAHVEDDLGRQLVTSGVIGAASTTVSLVAFLALRDAVGPYLANALAVVVTAVANVWANRRYTFGRLGGHGRVQDYVRGAALTGLALIGSTVALFVARAAGLGRAGELAAVLVAWAGAAILRFSVLRDRPRTGRPDAAPLAPSTPNPPTALDQRTTR